MIQPGVTFLEKFYSNLFNLHHVDAFGGKGGLEDLDHLWVGDEVYQHARIVINWIIYVIFLPFDCINSEV